MVLFCKEDFGERVLEVGECIYICGGCGIDGFGSDVGSKFREVDNKIVIRAEFWDVGSSFSIRDVIFYRF